MIIFKKSPPLIFDSPLIKDFYSPFLSRLKNVDEFSFSSLVSSCSTCFPSSLSFPSPPEGFFSSPFIFIGRNPSKSSFSSPFPPLSQSNRFLKKFLSALSLHRSDCYLSNALFCSFPSPPTPQELQSCFFWKFIEFHHLKQNNPKAFFLLGNSAIQQFFGLSFPSIHSLFPVVYLYGSIKIVPLFHPGTLLRFPYLFPKVKSFLQELKKDLV